MNIMETSFDLIVEKMRKYCLYHERSHFDVRTKLIKDKVFGDELEEVMSVLITENFLNEERYAKAYAIGKFRQNRWGKIKIKMELKKIKVSDYCIRKGLEEISEEEYGETIKKLWDKKIDSLNDSNQYSKEQKTIKYLLNKGYEYEMIKSFSK